MTRIRGKVNISQEMKEDGDFDGDNIGSRMEMNIESERGRTRERIDFEL